MSILQQRTIAALLTSLVVATGPCLAESPAMPGTVTVEERLDLSETGENLTLGQVRAVRTYKGKVLTSMSYVDESGQLCAPSSRGYAIARYTYYDNKWLKTTEFFDAQGQPVNCSEGYQKIENIYTPNGMRTRRVYKNAQGEETIGPEGYSRMEAQYINRRMIHQAFYNPDGELVNVPYARFDSVEEKGPFKKSGSHSLKAQYTLADGSLYYNAATGYARVENTYLNRQHRTRTAYFGADGKPIVNPVAGFSVEERVIGQDYQLAGVRYYDENGNPMIGPDGYSTILYFKHKERYCLVDGKIVSPFVPDMMPDSGEVQWKFAQHSTEFYLDENGYPLANEDGYCGRSVINFKTGRPSHIWYLGNDGEPVMTAMGYAMVRNSYTSKNLLIRSEYFDEQGKPIDTAEGYQRVESRYSLRKLEQEIYYDKNGNLVNCTDGYAEKLNAYDKRNNLVRQETLDIEGKRVGTCTVYVKDPDDHALSEMTLDDQDREKRNKNGYSEIRYEWNGVKNSQAYYFQGAPVMDVNGVHEIRYGYTVTGKVAEEAYYDIDGQPCENVRGVSRIVNEYNEDDDLIATYNYDISGNLTQMGREYAYSRKTYNVAHTEYTETYYNARNEQVERGDGAAKRLVLVDPKNRVISETTLDREDKPVEVRGIATIAYTRNNKGGELSRVYLDARGERASLEVVEIRKEYDRDNRVVSEVSYGPDGEEVMQVRRQYDERNRMTWEGTYLNGEPIENDSGVFAVSKTYDDNGNVATETYLDSQGQVMANLKGIARVEYLYDDLYRVRQISYLDENGREADPEVRREYDAFGNIIREAWYSQGQPTEGSRGCHAVVRKYDVRKMLEETTLDVMNLPVENGDGYATVQKTYDAAGNAIGEAYLDAEGQPVLRRQGYASVERTYNERNKVIREAYFGSDGKPVELWDGYAVIEREYDHAGNVIVERYLNSSGQLVLRRQGYSSVARTYNGQNKVVREAYFGLNGEPVFQQDDYAVIERDYDIAGNAIAERYFDISGQSVLRKQGYASVEKTYNERNKVIREAYYDTDGKPVELLDGYAVIERDYDVAGNVTAERYLDSAEQPVLHRQGYASLERTYNGQDRVIREAYFDTEGKPVSQQDNYAVIEKDYDGDGNVTAERYFDETEQPVLASRGMHLSKRHTMTRKRLFVKLISTQMENRWICWTVTRSSRETMMQMAT